MAGLLALGIILESDYHPDLVYPMATYQTGIVAEFYVLSALYRLGIDANMTLGNRKAVDILAITEQQVPISIDAKGLAGKTGWPVDNVKEGKRTHFLVFLCFLGTIENLATLPAVYVLPSLELGYLVYQAPSGRFTGYPAFLVGVHPLTI